MIYRLQSLSARYNRAQTYTPPKLAATTPGVSIEGYWISNSKYFFLSERIHRKLGRIIWVPCIADLQQGTVRDLCSLEGLLKTIASQSTATLRLEDFAAPMFDMPDESTLAVSVGGNDYLLDHRANRVLKVCPSVEAPGLYSPDGTYVCVTDGYDLSLVDRRSGARKSLTTDGARDCRYGQLPESALSAVSYRQRPYPLGMWSPDSQWFVTHQIDERRLPELTLIKHVQNNGTRPISLSFKYPIPGDPVAVATYIAIHVASGRMVRFDAFPDPITVYSPFSWRTVWFAPDNKIHFVRRDRYFRTAELIRLDPEAGSGNLLVSETVSSGYIDLHPIMSVTPNVRTLTGSNEILWYSERDGWGHLYLYDGRTGEVKNRITEGEWLVRDIVHVDPTRRTLFFLASGLEQRSDPAYRSLCCINFDGTGFRVMASHDGDLYVPRTEPFGNEQDRPFRPQLAQPGVSPDNRYIVLRRSSVVKGNRTEILDLSLQGSMTIAEALPKAERVLVREFAVPVGDSETTLFGVMFLPSDFDETHRYPLVDYIYPGPHVLHKPQSFCAVDSGPAMALAELGFITIMMDTRGMPARSRRVHQMGYGNLKEPQLGDHAKAIQYLCARHAFIDAERVGVIGHSAGGSAAAQALFDYGDIFRVGVAVCGEYDPANYAAMWAEKYIGPTADLAEHSICAKAKKLKGKLLLISGDMDENVPLSQTFSMVAALIAANKLFDLLIVPNVGHMLLMENGYVQRRVWDYFVQNLSGETPPSEFGLTFEKHELQSFETRFWREIRQ